MGFAKSPWLKCVVVPPNTKGGSPEPSSREAAVGLFGATDLMWSETTAADTPFDVQVRFCRYRFSATGDMIQGGKGRGGLGYKFPV